VRFLRKNTFSLRHFTVLSSNQFEVYLDLGGNMGYFGYYRNNDRHGLDNSYIFPLILVQYGVRARTLRKCR
jgi:hypothetical protein